jgi:hypothetical protein
VASSKRNRSKQRPAGIAGTAPGSSPSVDDGDLEPSSDAEAAPPTEGPHRHIDEEIGLTPRKPGAINAVLVVAVVILLVLATLALLIYTKA